MFSVDNFYTFMNSHYGLEADGRNLLCYFNPHGSKDWKTLRSGFIDLIHQRQNRYLYDSKGCIILHDQEPFDRSSLNIYKQQDSIEKNEIWRQSRPDDEVILVNQMVSLGWPIFCHSEYKSHSIEFVEQAGAASCHYFWHGLISRDWFRHWKHHGGISLSKASEYRFLLYARESTGTRQYRSQMINDLMPIKHQVNYNWDQTNIVSSEHSAIISVEDSQSSAIHLVAETVFDQQKIHLTEKIFKPMVMLQPFIVFAGAGALEYLRGYGFQTFGDIWDESYDQISNHQERYQKILDLIRYLSDLDKEKLNQILEQARSIVLHNHQRFFSNEFEDQMLKELKTNMSNCLSWQDEKTRLFPGGAAFYVLEKRISNNIDSVVLKKRCVDTLMYFKKTDVPRYEAILRQYPDLCRNLV